MPIANSPACRFASSLPKLAILVLISLQSFTLFSNLPYEIRHKIWQLSCLHPRQIALRANVLWSIAESLTIEEKYRTTPLLSVNREARTEALKHYTLCTEVTEANPGWTPILRSNIIYANFDVDIFIHRDCSHRHAQRRVVCNIDKSYNFDLSVMRQIQHVALISVRRSKETLSRQT
jgi:hypothetical protein